MDIIAHAGAVGCIVIVAEHRQFAQPSGGDAADEGHQIVRNAVRILADQSAVVRAHGVEIAKDRDAPLWIGGGDVGEHLLDNQLGRSEEHTSELQSLMRISYAVFCLKKKKITKSSTEQKQTQLDSHQPTRYK